MTRFPPIRNATLTAVNGGGGAEDYDTDPTTGAAKWSGSERVFVNDAAISDDTGERSSIDVERSIVVDDALTIDWARGDTLAYTMDRDGAQTGRVRDIKVTSAPGLLGVVRLILEDS